MVIISHLYCLLTLPKQLTQRKFNDEIDCQVTLPIGNVLEESQIDNSGTGLVLERFHLLWQTCVFPKGHSPNLFAGHKDVKCVCLPPIQRDNVDPVSAYLRHKNGDAWNVNNQSHQSKKLATNKTKVQEDGEEACDGCIRTCHCLVSASGVAKKQPRCMFDNHFNAATFLTSLLPMHGGDKRKELKRHSPWLLEVVDYKNVFPFDQAQVNREQISIISGFLALLVFLCPNAQGISRIDVLRQIYKPFHEPGSVWEKSINLFSKLKDHLENGFASYPNYQEFFSVNRGKFVEIKTLFRLEYEPAKGQESKAIEHLRLALAGKLTGSFDNSDGLWIQIEGKKNGKLSAIMKKSSKIIEAVVKVLTQKKCECNNDDDKYNEKLLCVQEELEDAISKTITSEIDDEKKKNEVSHLIKIPVEKFAWTMTQRLLSLQFVAKNAKYECYGGCGRKLNELANDSCISWDDYINEKGLEKEEKKKRIETRREMEDSLNFGNQICTECRGS